MKVEGVRFKVRVQGSGFMDWGLGFGLWDFGFSFQLLFFRSWVWSLGFRVEGSGRDPQVHPSLKPTTSRFYALDRLKHPGANRSIIGMRRPAGPGCRRAGTPRTPDFEFSVSSLGFQFWVLVIRVPFCWISGFGFRFFGFLVFGFWFSVFEEWVVSVGFRVQAFE